MAVNHWPLQTDPISSPSLLSGGQGAGLNVPTLESHGWLSQQPVPIHRCFQKSSRCYNKRRLYHSQHLENSKGFRSCDQGIVDEDLIYVKNLFWLFE